MYDIFFISGFQHIRQSLHSLSCCDAGQTLDVAPNHGWSLVITLELLGHDACARWFTMGALNRMTKFVGLLSRCFLIHASRVGNQWRLDGVSSHTSKIFIRWSRSWTSPLSCHLNTSGFFEFIKWAIASTHCGLLIAASLRYCAPCTTLKT